MALTCHGVLGITCFWTRKTVRTYAAGIYALHYVATMAYIVLISEVSMILVKGTPLR